jgi:hypothetical protein
MKFPLAYQPLFSGSHGTTGIAQIRSGPAVEIVKIHLYRKLSEELASRGLSFGRQSASHNGPERGILGRST